MEKPLPEPFVDYGAGGVWPRNSSQGQLLALIAKLKAKHPTR